MPYTTEAKTETRLREPPSFPKCPVISYYGGKQRLVSKLVPLIPKHTVYVEPFAGGAALLFAKPWPNVTNINDYYEVINDTDERLVTFYRVLRDPELGPRLVERIQLTPYSKSEYELAWEILHDPSAVTLVDRAWAYYVQVMQSFARKLHGGWGRAVFGRNLAVTWMNKVACLPEYLERMASVHIESVDAIECIRKWDSPQTFFYCDPPYPMTDQGHYSYTQEQFEELCDVLDTIDGSFLLSCYDNPAAKSHWERFEFDAYCSVSGRGKVGLGRDKSRKATSVELGHRKRIEVVWRKLRSKPVRPEIAKLFASGAFDCFTGDEKPRQLSLW